MLTKDVCYLMKGIDITGFWLLPENFIRIKSSLYGLGFPASALNTS